MILLLASMPDIGLLWCIVRLKKKTVSRSKADKMLRKQQFSITASSLTFHNPPRVGGKKIGFYLTPALTRLPWRVCLSWFLIPQKHKTRHWQPHTGNNKSRHGARRYRQASQMNRCWSRQMKAEMARDWRVGEETEQISDPLFNEHCWVSYAISKPSFKKQKQTPNISPLSCFQPLCRFPLKFTGEVFKQATGSQTH